MASLHAAFKFLSLPNACPLSIIALDPNTGKPIAVNSTFESIFGPFYKFKEWEFSNAATEDSPPTSKGKDPSTVTEDLNRTKFRNAINNVCSSLLKYNDGDGGVVSGNIRNVEMLTLGTNEAGLPIRKYFDWTIGSVKLEEEEDKTNIGGCDLAVILYGTLVNEVESTNR